MLCRGARMNAGEERVQVDPQIGMICADEKLERSGKDDGVGEGESGGEKRADSEKRKAEMNKKT